MSGRVALGVGALLGAALAVWGLFGMFGDAGSMDLMNRLSSSIPQDAPQTASGQALVSTTGSSQGARSPTVVPTPETPPTPSAAPTQEISAEADTFLGGQVESGGKPATPAAPEVDSIHIPDRIVIPAIHLDAPIVRAQSNLVKVDGSWLPQWQAPDQLAAGWHTSSAPLGAAGNTVLNGHHNEFGEVFGHLVDLKAGDEITVFAGDFSRRYAVANVMILPERNQALQTRLQNARWLEPTTDERLTLITCWPKWTNTHRLVIVASPIP